jgi:hypothetical protein
MKVTNGWSSECTRSSTVASLGDDWRESSFIVRATPPPHGGEHATIPSGLLLLHMGVSRGLQGCPLLSFPTIGDPRQGVV